MHSCGGGHRETRRRRTNRRRSAWPGNSRVTRWGPIERFGGWPPGRHGRNERSKPGRRRPDKGPSTCGGSALSCASSVVPCRDSRAVQRRGRHAVVPAAGCPRSGGDRLCAAFSATLARATDAPGLVLHGLKQLEYRGYDSWGIAVAARRRASWSRSGPARSGRRRPPCPPSSVGLGHTRWATHGGVTDAERPPAPRLHRPAGDHPQRHRPEPPRAAPRAARTAATPSAPRPTPRSSRTCSKRRSAGTATARSALVQARHGDVPPPGGPERHRRARRPRAAASRRPRAARR